MTDFSCYSGISAHNCIMRVMDVNIYGRKSTFYYYTLQVLENVYIYFEFFTFLFLMVLKMIFVITFIVQMYTFNVICMRRKKDSCDPTTLRQASAVMSFLSIAEFVLSPRSTAVNFLGLSRYFFPVYV